MSSVIGITGPTGSGKSVLSSYLAGKGFVVLDCDRIYADMTKGPSACMDALRRNFGDEIVNPEGGLDRAVMRNLVFGPGNEERLALLNRTTHVFVTDRIREIISEKKEPGYVIDAPLLFEAGADILCDGTIAVVAPYRTRLKRLRRRDGLPDGDIRRRMASGHTCRWFRRMCTFTLNNRGSERRLQRRADRYIAAITGKKQ